MNVVFDLGGVVVTWKPDEIIANVFADSKERDLARSMIFGHADWCELDRGTLPRHQAIKRSAARTGLTVSAITDLMRKVPLALVVIPETVDLLYRLQAQGHRLFYLSNMHIASIEHLEHRYTFWDIFEGGIISCRVHLIKPEPAIYKCLLETYNLVIGQTLFIDDSEVNLMPAAHLGVQTIHFKQPEQCEDQLKEIGLI